MERRTFIGACAGSLVIARSDVEAQPAAKSLRVGFLTYTTPEQSADGPETSRCRDIQGSLFFVRRQWVADLALQHRLPAIHGLKEYAQAGLLMTYGANLADLYRRAAGYIDRIAKGAKPGDLPVEQPTQFDLVINLSTAKALGLAIPQSLLLRADEVVR
jgi:putative ABC transport system substrate-binding protein